MKTQLFFFILVFSLFFSCSKSKSEEAIVTPSANSVLLLKVDYLTNTFEGGKELTFANSPTFTISKQYTPPGDFGELKLFYQELNQPIFKGTIIWMGLGSISFPNNFDLPNTFSTVLTTDFVVPSSGFENIHNPDNQNIDYTTIWSHIQNLVKVRQYLTSNPNATVKVFLYTPSVGVGNPADWDWIFILKN